MSSRWATVGLVLSLLPIVPIFPPLALLFGLLGRSEISRSRLAMVGAGRASFAIFAGLVGTAGWAALYVYAQTADLSGLMGFWQKTRLAAGMGILEELPHAQVEFRSNAFADQDHDGKGEFGSSQALKEKLKGFDLTLLEQGTLGWRLSLVLPRSVNARERTWWAFLQPVDDSNGTPWLYIDESRILRRGDNVQDQPTRRTAKTWRPTSTESFIEDMFAPESSTSPAPESSSPPAP